MTRSALTHTYDRDDFDGIGRTVVLQALHKREIPANAMVHVIRWVASDTPYFVEPRLSAIFDSPRRFALWAVKEGYVPEEYRAHVLRYARS
jgi:hypothetical protein